MDQQASTSDGRQVPSSHVEQHIKKKSWLRWVSYMRYKEQLEPVQSQDLLGEKERRSYKDLAL